MANFENFKEFLKPTIKKILISLLLLGYGFYSELSFRPWSHSPTPFRLFGIFDFFNLNYVISLILFGVFVYFLSCIFTLAWRTFKNKKIFGVVSIVFFIFLMGIDETVVNHTINYPKTSCSVDSDCKVAFISKDGCGNIKCVNLDWQYYDSMINSVYALSCAPPKFNSCTCANNKCTPIPLQIEDWCPDTQKICIGRDTKTLIRGKEGIFEVTIKNVENADFNNLVIKINSNSPEGFAKDNKELNPGTSSWIVTPNFKLTLSKNESQIIKIPVTVSDDAPSGTYIFNIDIFEGETPYAPRQKIYIQVT